MLQAIYPSRPVPTLPSAVCPLPHPPRPGTGPPTAPAPTTGRCSPGASCSIGRRRRHPSEGEKTTKHGGKYQKNSFIVKYRTERPVSGNGGEMSAKSLGSLTSSPPPPHPGSSQSIRSGGGRSSGGGRNRSPGWSR